MKKQSNLSSKVRTDGCYQDVHVKQAIKLLKEEMDKEFISVEKGVPEEIASVCYVFKQVIKKKIDKIFGHDLVK